MPPINWVKRLNIDVSSPKIRSFGSILAFILLAVVGYKFIRYDEFILILLLLGMGIGFTAFTVPHLLKIVYVPWMIVALTIGAVISYFLLFLVFFLILTPVGLIMKMLARSPLRMGEKVDSYWIMRDQNKQTDFKRMF